MNSETLCQICSQLICSPIILSCCSASVCLECIKNISQKDKRNPDKLYYKCRLCSKDHQPFDSKKANTFLSRYIEYSHQKGYFEDVDCENCGIKKNFVETFGCNECNQKFLCKDCYSVSHNVSINKNHKTVNHGQIIKGFTGSLEKAILCQDHLNQKIEHICLKDLTTLCASCVAEHTKICKEKKLLPFEKSHAELAKQLSHKFEQLNEYRNKVDEEYTSLKQRLEDYQTNSQGMMNLVEKQFQELKEILVAKEIQVKNFLVETFAHHKEKLNQEIIDLDVVNKKTGNLINMVEFAVSYPESYFCEGAKYLVQRFNKLSNSFSKLEHAKYEVHDNFKLVNFAESKEALLRLSLSEIEKPPARRTNVFVKSKSSVFTDDTFSQTERLLTDFIPLKTENPFNEAIITTVEKIKIPATPRTEVINLSKARGLHSKTKSIAVNNPNFFGSFKLEKSPNHRQNASQANSPSAQGQLRRDKYSNIFSKLNTSAKNLKQAPTKTPDPKTAKMTSQASTPSLQHSRVPSKSSFSFKTAPPKSSCESPKIKSFGSSIDLGNWTFNLSPQKREENPYTEQELELIQEAEKNPLMKRKFMKISQTANSIFVSWPHSPQDTKITYQLDYGIGAKVQNTEQFRTAFKGNEGSFIIAGLAPKTKYRLRVCPICPKEENNHSSNPNSNPNSVSPRGRTSNETIGPWSDIITVVTKDNQTIDPHAIGAACASVNTIGKETIVDFEKAGRVVAKNEYDFGKTAWEIKIKRQSAHAAPVDSYSFLKIGVASKAGKSANILGKLFNYALNTESITIKVFLDIDNRSMTVLTGNDKDSEVFNNLPPGPLYPAFQNKISKDSFSSLKLHVKFDLPYTLNESKDLG